MFSRPRQPIFFPGLGLLLFILTVAVTLALLAGCASTNAIAAGQTLEQKAYAAYGTFVVFEEQGAKIVTDPTTPTSIKSVIRAADAKAKPTADTLVSALQQYEIAKNALSSGATTSDKLSIASANLSTWITQATNDTQTLITAVKSAPPH